MKRLPTSKIFHTALYLHHVCGQRTFTVRDIHNAMPDARVYYRSLIPAHVFAERDRICQRHHPTATQGHDDTYTDWWDHDCDVALRALFRPYITFNYRYYNANLTHAETSNACLRHGYLTRDETTKPFVYHITPKYVHHPMFNQED